VHPFSICSSQLEVRRRDDSLRNSAFTKGEFYNAFRMSFKQGPRHVANVECTLATRCGAFCDDGIGAGSWAETLLQNELPPMSGDSSWTGSRRPTDVARQRTSRLGVFDSAQPQLCRYCAYREFRSV
jgi:hypothetical protein